MQVVKDFIIVQFQIYSMSLLSTRQCNIGQPLNNVFFSAWCAILIYVPVKNQNIADQEYFYI